jgi:hypothetical protein
MLPSNERLRPPARGGRTWGKAQTDLVVLFAAATGRSLNAIR